MKYCMDCGTKLPEEAKFCGRCGLPQAPLEPPSPRPPDGAPPADDEQIPELHEPPAPAAPPVRHQPAQPAEPPVTPPPTPEPPVAPIAAPMPAASDTRTMPPVPVASQAFREPYEPRPPASDEPLMRTSALPWDDADRDDLVPPPASAYADESPSEPDPPPTPSYDTYVVSDPSPPLGAGMDVANLPPPPAWSDDSGPVGGPANEPSALPATAKRPNWIKRHKLLAATIAVVSAVIIAAAVNSRGESPGPSAPQSPGVQLSSAPGSTDQDVAVGSSALIDGMQAFVLSAASQGAIDETHTEGYLVVDVRYVNVSGQSKQYNSLDWKIQSPSGAVTGTESVGGDDQLTSGELQNSGDVAGKITFKVGDEKGQFLVIWKPDPVDPARGVWRIPVN